MFEGKKVIDVHGHMTTPPTFRAAVAGMVSQNTPPHGLEIPDEALANATSRRPACTTSTGTRCMSGPRS